MVAVYTNRGEDFDRSNLANVRVYKFLNNKSTLLNLLPPTEDAFLQHLKRAALATLIDKSLHISKPSLTLAKWLVGIGNITYLSPNTIQCHTINIQSTYNQ